MNKLTIKLDCWFDDQISEYLMQLNGINRVVVDKNLDVITILYNINLINIYIIVKEIKLFLDVDKIPLIISFDKYLRNNLSEYIINIKDLCCEYCLNGNMEELLMIDGIVLAVNDYDYVNKRNVKLKLCYDNSVINKEELIKLEKKFNYE